VIIELGVVYQPTEFFPTTVNLIGVPVINVSGASEKTLIGITHEEDVTIVESKDPPQLLIFS
jgi:hypothetical protein